MTDIDEIEGVGPAYAEELEDAGYESAEDVAEADPDEINDVLASADGETVVSNATDVADVGSDEATGSDETVDDGLIELEPGFSNEQRYHLVKALVDREIMARRTNQPDRHEMIQDAIEQVMAGEPYQFTLEQVSEAYTGINQHEASLRSERGIAGFVSEIRKVKNELQSARQANWPE